MDRLNDSSRASRVDLTSRLLVVGRIAGLRFAWPASSVERVLAMAAVTHVPDLPYGVVGLIDVHGDTLAVVDPRPRLGLPTQPAHPDQHLLLLLHGTSRFLLWVDAVEAIVTIKSTDFESVQGASGDSSAPFITRVDGRLVSVLSPSAFDPGQVVPAAAEPR